MKADTAASRLARCTERMEEQGIDVLLLTKPANMQYLTGDGRLCAFTMITRQGQVGLGVPTTAFLHGEKEPPPLPENVVVSIGNCGLYLGPWGVRVEDTVAIGKDGPDLLTSFPKELTP